MNNHLCPKTTYYYESKDTLWDIFVDLILQLSDLIQICFLVCYLGYQPVSPINKHLLHFVVLPVTKICNNVYNFSLVLAMGITKHVFEIKLRKKKIKQNKIDEK